MSTSTVPTECVCVCLSRGGVRGARKNESVVETDSKDDAEKVGGETLEKREKPVVEAVTLFAPGVVPPLIFYFFG